MQTHNVLAVPVLMLSPAGPLADRANMIAVRQQGMCWNVLWRRVLSLLPAVILVFCMGANGFCCPTAETV